MTKIRKALREFIIFYFAGLLLTVVLVVLKICYPELDSMLLTGLAGVLIVPLIKEAFSRLKSRDLLETIRRRRDKDE